MSTKAEKIPRLINDILDYISKEPLYCNLDKDELVKNKVEIFLQEFATKNNFPDLDIVQFGITLVGVDIPFVRGEPYFFDSVATKEVEDKFNKWYEGYKEIPLKINELLCDKSYEKKWKQELHKFPMIIVYSNKKPYFLKRENDNEFHPMPLEELNYNDIFEPDTAIDKEKKFKDALLLLHKQFTEKEEYSPFKIFFTSNFKDLCAQTFIKFKEPIIDINNPSELKEFIKLCFLVDRAIGSYVYSVQASIYQHKYTKKILEHSKKAAIASIMGRNMSHNIGSHVLSSLNLNNVSKDQIADFHSYLQKRMDLLARMIGERPSWGEPMYFIGDLLKGFFSQTLLLNYIVNDQGGWKWEWKGGEQNKKIKFIVNLPDNKNISFKYKSVNSMKTAGKEEDIYSWETTDNYKDFLVSIPEGVIGAQAFYIFMESMMRNSAKYGKAKEKVSEFEVYIEVIEGTSDIGSYYNLKIWDNLSICDGTVSRDIQSKIQKKLIDEDTGKLWTKDLGIAEMREACDFLIHPNNEDFPAHIDGDEKYPLWAECPITDKERCIDNCSFKYLSYTFNLANPKMVAIVNDESITLHEDADKYGIKKVSEEDLLINKGAYQFVLFDINQNNKDKILKFIKDNKRKLPQRLLLVIGNVDSIKIEPERRAVICSKNDIKIDCLLKSENDKSIIYKQFITRVYEMWIRKRWLNGGKASLFISFQYNDGPLWDRWDKIKKSDILKDEVNLYLKRIKENGAVEIPDKFHRENNKDSSDFRIYYDHHGIIKKANNDATPYFISEIGSYNKKIIEALLFPPQNQFGFDLFLLGLIEAGLTKVVIVDERIAGTSVDLSEFNTVLLEALNDATCYPLFAIGKEGDCKTLTPALKDHYQVCDKFAKDQYVLLRWGEKFDIVNLENKILLKPDFIIFHKGIIETIVKELFITECSNNKFDWLERLYDLVPSVVITSGRGEMLKDKDIIPSDSPFMEFSTLSENTSRSISKYHLIRSLMSIKGNYK